MIIKKAKLENIRNYENEEVTFDSDINIIIGKNGQGKTNLIESIYVSAFSKSFRTSKEKEIVNFNSKIGSINIDYLKDGEEENISFYISNKGEKNIKINGVKIEKMSQLIGNILVVVFSPEDLKIIKEDPEKRRSFIDRELCQLSLSYFNNLSKYKKILLQRNKYLKENSINKEILEVWNESLALHGKEIINKRIEFVKKLNNISKDIHKNIKAEEVLEIKYKGNIDKDADFLSILNENIDNDINARTTTRGPHRDDIEIFINNVNTRKFGSQGQQRTAALSLKLAEIQLIKEEKEESPILLLDDVMSELDEERQKFIIKYLKDVQLFITTTHISEEINKLVKDKNIYKIENGSIIK